MAVALTLNRIYNGDGGGAFTHANVATAPVAADATGNTFAISQDRRVFLWIKNTSGEARVGWITVHREWNSGAGDILKTTAGGTTGIDNVANVVGQWPVLIPADSTARLYAVSNPTWFRDSDGLATITIKDNATPWAVDVTGITIAAYYLPWADATSGATSSTPAEVDIPFANPVALTVQTITPAGIAPTFTEQAADNGWLLPLFGDSKTTDGRRRFFWIKNNTGAARTLVHIGAFVSNSDIQHPINSASGLYVAPGFQTETINHTVERFLGPWDPRVWAGGNSTDSAQNSLWTRGLTGPYADLKIAWLELPP